MQNAYEHDAVEGSRVLVLPDAHSRIISDILQGEADAEVVDKFFIHRDVINAAKAERVQHVAQELDLEDLWSGGFVT